MRGRRNKGRWTKDEHKRFLSVAGQLGKNKESWRWISQVVVTTRSPAQVRTHAQKYFRKIGQGLPFPDEPYTNDRANDGESGEEGQEQEEEEEEEEEEKKESASSAARGGAPLSRPPTAMATTPDGAGLPLPPIALFGGQMRLAGAPAMDSLGPGRIVPYHGYEDGDGASTGDSFPHAIGAPALPPLCFPGGIAPGFGAGQGGQDSRLDPHVAAAAAAETAAGAAALGHDLDGGMFLPIGGGGTSSALPPLWADASIGDASGGGFLLDSWPSELGP